MMVTLPSKFVPLYAVSISACVGPNRPDAPALVKVRDEFVAEGAVGSQLELQVSVTTSEGAQL